MEKRSADSQVKGVSTGTTILAATFDGGVVIGSDSRASIGGDYVSSKTINKVIQVHDQIFCCIAGSLADAQAVTKAAKFHLSFHSVQMGTPPLVIAAASVLRELCYKNKEELQAGFITAGWDRKKGPQVYVVSLGGMLIAQPVTIGGSGSTYIYGYVDAKYKPNMSREECLQFATNALALAMGRDNVSGGVAHLVVITETGAEHVVVPGNKLGAAGGRVWVRLGQLLSLSISQLYVLVHIFRYSVHTHTKNNRHTKVVPAPHMSPVPMAAMRKEDPIFTELNVRVSVV